MTGIRVWFPRGAVIKCEEDGVRDYSQGKVKVWKNKAGTWLVVGEFTRMQIGRDVKEC